MLPKAIMYEKNSQHRARVCRKVKDWRVRCRLYQIFSGLFMNQNYQHLSDQLRLWLRRSLPCSEQNIKGFPDFAFFLEYADKPCALHSAARKMWPLWESLWSTSLLIFVLKIAWGEVHTTAPSSIVSSDISASSSLDMRFMKISANVAATPGKTYVQGKPSDKTDLE